MVPQRSCSRPPRADLFSESTRDRGRSQHQLPSCLGHQRLLRARRLRQGVPQLTSKRSKGRERDEFNASACWIGFAGRHVAFNVKRAQEESKAQLEGDRLKKCQLRFAKYFSRLLLRCCCEISEEPPFSSGAEPEAPQGSFPEAGLGLAADTLESSGRSNALSQATE